MGTPPDANAFVEDCWDWGGVEIAKDIRKHFDPAGTSILDVGAGWGKYRWLLAEYSLMDAAEVWAPTIESQGLTGLYRRVWIGDIAESPVLTVPYTVAIWGDCLEHLSVVAAQRALEVQRAVGVTEVYVYVPFGMPQAPCDDNPYERHVQADLTPDVMLVRYPMLRLYRRAPDGTRGLYTWQPSRPEKQVRSVEALRAQLAGMLVGREVA